MNITVLSILVVLLGASFLVAGTVNIVGPKALRDAYVSWGYPAWFHRVSGGLDVLAAALLVSVRTRVFGLSLALAICAGAFLTLAWHRQWRKTPPSLLLGVFVACLLAVTTDLLG